MKKIELLLIVFMCLVPPALAQNNDTAASKINFFSVPVKKIKLSDEPDLRQKLDRFLGACYLNNVQVFLFNANGFKCWLNGQNISFYDDSIGVKGFYMPPSVDFKQLKVSYNFNLRSVNAIAEADYTSQTKNLKGRKKAKAP